MRSLEQETMIPTVREVNDRSNPTRSLRGKWFLLLLLLFLGLVTGSLPSAMAGVLTRKPNTTLKMPQDPKFAGYNLTDAFGPLQFLQPVAIASPPGETNRLFIVERVGRVSVITNLAKPGQAVYLDLQGVAGNPNIESGLMGIAFHPGFATNRYFYIFQTRLTADIGYANVLLRFQQSATDPNRAAPESETVIMRFPDPSDEHNAGDLHFGPDGYLYVPMGDIGPSVSQQSNLQPLDQSFFGGILRIDVDNKATNLVPNPLLGATLNYRVPVDNPFVGITSYQGSAIAPGKLRTEFYAIGLRNPWRIAFDSKNGALYCGDVGGAEVEEVNVIKKGGNYGWPYLEGGLRFVGGATPAGFNPVAPLVSYRHGRGTNEGVAIIGGVVYRGTAIAALQAGYLFADNLRGHIWVTYPESAANPKTFTRLIAEPGISGFGTDPRNKDVLVVNVQSGTLKRLSYVAPASSVFPATLALAGVFSDLKTLTPNPGIVPYEINVPFWSDHAIKSRYLALPNTNLTYTFAPQGNWSFPTGSVWVKHFEMEMTNGVPASRRRLETRLLVKTAGGVYGVTYKWDAAGTGATLVPENGIDEKLVIRNGSLTRTQMWHYPTRGECLMCHTREGGFALGFSTAQLNIDHAYPGGTDNQIKALGEAGYLQNPPADLSRLRHLSPAADTNAPLGVRVRSYLASNCSACHQGGGPSTLDVFWDARVESTLEQTRLIPSYVAPGNLASSRVYQRLTDRNNLMPLVGTAVVNTNGVNLIAEWINSFPPSPWVSKDVGSVEREGSATHVNGTFAVSGAGLGVGGTADGLQFLYRPVSNNVQMIAKLESQQAPDTHSQAGLMIRASNAAGAPFGMIAQAGDTLSHFWHRSTGNGVAGDQSGGSSPSPLWLKLVREGSFVRGFTSTDGSNWQFADQRSVPLDQVTLIGMAAASGKPFDYNTSRFTNVSLLSARLLNPDPGSSFTVPAVIPVVASVPLGQERVTKVSFYSDGQLLQELTQPPYEVRWTNGLAGDHIVSAVLTDVSGSQLSTEQVLVHLTLPAPDAFPAESDTTTQGNWSGVVGGDGQVIAGDSTNLPPSILVAFANAGFQAWEIPSSDPRALRRSVGTERVAAAWGGGDRWTADLRFLDGELHRVRLYFLDWDNRGRTQTVEVQDGASGQILDRRELAHFESGVYLGLVARGHVRLVFSGAAAAGGAVLSGLFFDESRNQAPTVTLISPSLAETYVVPTNVVLQAQAVDPDGAVQKVEFFANDVKVGEALSPPYLFLWEHPLAGVYELQARATDNFKDVADSSALQLRLDLPASTVSFLGRNPTLGGNWRGIYGREGYEVVNSGQLAPDYLELNTFSTRTFTWVDRVADPRALLHPSDEARIASCWVATSGYSFDISFNDGLPHILSCYFLDWDSVTRRQRVILRSPQNSAQLDTQEVSDFHNGVYLSWMVQGRVLLSLIPLEGNVVTSGLFLDAYLPELAPGILETVGEVKRIRLSWQTFPGQRYVIEYATDLRNPVWVAVPGEILATGPSATQTVDLPVGAPQVFYRVRIVR